MADDKNLNEDPEENHFDDDEDFGLPDLEYDELDDDGDEPMDDEPFDDELEEEVVEEEVPVIEDTPEPVGEEMLEEEITEDDLGSFDDSEPEDWEKELEKELEEELLAEGDTGGFYEEESFEDFDSDEIGMESDDNEVAASVFGSDDDSDDIDAGIEYTEPAANAGGTVPPAGGSYQTEPSGGRGKFVRYVVFGVLGIAVVAFVLLLIFRNSEETPKKVAAKKEVPAKKAPEKKVEPKQEEEAKPAETKPAETTPVAKKEEPKKTVKKEEPKPQPAVQKPAGEITSLTEKTGKTYIIVSSFFDDDLAQDFASKLSKDGRSPIVIPPFGESRFYRVAIAEYNSFADAKAGLEGFKAEFGQDIWPLRY